MSMKKEDSFFKRLANSELPFGEPQNFNKKTLGVLVVCLFSSHLPPECNILVIKYFVLDKQQ